MYINRESKRERCEENNGMKRCKGKERASQTEREGERQKKMAEQERKKVLFL